MAAVVLSWASERCQFLVAVLGPGQEAAEKEEKPATWRVSWGGWGFSSGLSRKLWELILESQRFPSSPTWGGDASQAVLWAWAPGLSGVVGSAGGPGSGKLSQVRNCLSRLQKDRGAHWGHSRASRPLFSLSSVTTPDMVFYGHYPLDGLKCSGWNYMTFSYCRRKIR